MHEIAFQADKRFAEGSVCADCSSQTLVFHEGILFVITFTRRIYSSSSHVFRQRLCGAAIQSVVERGIVS